MVYLCSKMGLSYNKDTETFMGIFYYESAHCIFILYAYGPIQSRRSKKRQEINPLTDLIFPIQIHLPSRGVSVAAP